MQTTPQTQNQNMERIEIDLHPVILRLMKKRFDEKVNNSQISSDIDFNNYIKDFFSWDLKTLPELTNLKDLKKAAQRVIEAIAKNEKIGIFGDYDVDGTTSCALFYHFFKSINYPVTIYQPGRFKEGYGLHPSSIEEAYSDQVKVLITVDCGITSNLAALSAIEKNIDLIVTDHHNDTLPEMVPAFAVINPNRRDEDPNSDLKSLAGVGVAFCLCLQIRNQLLNLNRNCPSLYPLLQFVAIGTISDLAPINSLNRKLVRHGLKQMPKTTFLGIKQFLTLDERNQEFISSEKIAFNIGPLINAKGRLDHPEVAYQLLICDSTEDALKFYRILEINNNERKLIQSKIFSEAKISAQKNLAKDPNLEALILYNSNWHEGVIGIVASKMVETFNLPSLVFTNAEEENTLKASVRSISNLNIFEALSECSHFFKKFGGHKMAAGLSLGKENLIPFENFFLNLLKNSNRYDKILTKQFDLEIDPNSIDRKLVSELASLEPFGPQNTRPLFRSKNLILESFEILKDIHVKWTFAIQNSPGKKLKGISFNYFDKINTIHPSNLVGNHNFYIYYQVGINRFNGIDYLQLMVNHVEIIYEG